MVVDMSQDIAKAKERMGLVEACFLSRGRLGVTTAMRILSDALGREGKYYSLELNTTGARAGPVVYFLRIGNSPLLPHGTFIQPDHVVIADAGKMTEPEPKSEEELVEKLLVIPAYQAARLYGVSDRVLEFPMRGNYAYPTDWHRVILAD